MSPWGLCYATFYDHYFGNFRNKLECLSLARPLVVFSVCPIFTCKAGALLTIIRLGFISEEKSFQTMDAGVNVKTFFFIAVDEAE